MISLPNALNLWLAQFNSTLALSRAQGIHPTPEQAREGLALITAKFTTNHYLISHVTSSAIAGNGNQNAVPCRIYQPAPDEPRPVILFLHGGGHMCGGNDVYDPIARRIAFHTCHTLVSIDYRLAPEHPYPAGLDDCQHALDNIWSLLDNLQIPYLKQLILVGDSAGGALAATLTQRCLFPTINKLIMIYPSLDYTFRSQSIAIFGKNYLLEADKMSWYFDQYFQTYAPDVRHNASPLWQAIDENHPPTLIITAGFDPLQDEGLMYADKLRDRQIPCCSLHLPDTLHAFLNLEDLNPLCCYKAYQAIENFVSVPIYT
ncbi:hypothetical protein ABT56_18540 [Photobacterium aquae]|uniref:Alpha/beta hydrolase fold-3 domain-containing protein n=1 Tax=Photobacterium aquae TaxID=1195763 RepID=A0A0J1JN20_9GAMM|nr:alpha/beta hydrolase [Photobacterium aquae]KLV03597.1 hypothetical protein ABT56_18540 [Photobacterium aquae]